MGIRNALRASMSVLEGIYSAVCGVIFILFFMYVMRNARNVLAFLLALKIYLR